MSFPIDADLIVFLHTVGKIVFGSMPRLRKIPTTRRIPVRYEFAQLNPASLTEAQERYFAPYDEKLAAMNFWPVCTYRITNHGYNLIRNYAGPGDTARFVVTIYEVALEVKGGRAVNSTSVLSFHTRFSDARVLTTRNQHLSMLDRPPYHIVQEFPGITDPAQLKREHDERAANLGCPVSPPADAASVLKDVQSEHERFNLYQLSQGTVRLNPDGKSYAFTDKVYWRGIRKHLNPFEHRFSMRRFLPAALVAMALPLFGVMKLAPATADAARQIGFPPAAAATFVVLACYLVAGALLGYVLEHRTFVWVFLLTYLTVRLFSGVPLGPMPYSAFAGMVAYSVAQGKKRRRAVLLPREA
jgi:hypothetical protein